MKGGILGKLENYEIKKQCLSDKQEFAISPWLAIVPITLSTVKVLLGWIEIKVV